MSFRHFMLSAAGLCCLSFPAAGQSSSSSANQGERATDAVNPTARPRAAQIEPGGAAVTLEYSEPLFEVAAALNVCGYDADLQRSAKVRTEVRTELNQIFAGNEVARSSRDVLCTYIQQHQLADPSLNIGQYVSLALYLSPPPELTPNVDETELPPQATQVVNVLQPLRAFAEATQLHVLWVRHRAEYEELAARVHAPMEEMILQTNIYLHQPVSSYDGRRFLVLLEPMLSPGLTNARIYGTDYIIVTSPDNTPTGDPVRMNEIRHIYLHYVVEPLVYSRGSAMQRIQPLLRGVADAPIDFAYRSDVEALLTECLIKAIEAHMYTLPESAPKRPGTVKNRTEIEDYETAKALYDRQTTAAQMVQVTRDDRAGWVLTNYFYQALANMGHAGDGLRDEIAPMIYGLDVDGERRRAEATVFVKDTSSDPLSGRIVAPPHKNGPMELAELNLMKGNVADAADLAGKVMADPTGDHGRAQYVLARIDLMQGQPDKAMEGFSQTLRLSQDPRTVAWSHIYLGRLYDNMNPPDRAHAVVEYQAALAARDARPDTKLAAENGIKQPFALPQRAQPKKADDEEFDPTGKAQKQAYKPGTPQ
ncbi:MAG: tetratricopeptide repeat protein [Janthinobacterium lividum]